MKTLLPSSRRPRAGFTLVELLTVIAIIGILASMLLVVLAAAKKHALVVQARLQISQIAGAIEQYDSVYGRFPVSTNAQSDASRWNSDFTYGGSFNGPNGRVLVKNQPLNTRYQATNNEVIGILMDLTNYPNGTPTVNANYVKNPQQTIFLNAKLSGYDPSSNLPQPPGGVDNTGVYRDPWGNPYVISLDLTYDDMCKDAFYCLDSVSGNNQKPANPSVDGLTTDGKPNNFQLRGKVMVWSAGPDGMISDQIPANTGVNKDNILSWQ